MKKLRRPLKEGILKVPKCPSPQASDKIFSFFRIFFAKTIFPQSLFGKKKIWLNFFSCKFGCQMKFWKKNVFPDPASRVSHKPLKLVTDPRNTFFCVLQVSWKSDRGNPENDIDYGFQEGKIYAKAITLDKGWGLLVHLVHCLKTACSGAQW